jgi:large subunit ribosomal protein L32e
MVFLLQIKQGEKFEHKMPKKFLRRTWNRYSKLGRKKKSKQKWRRPTGRDNKMREKRKGYPKTVSIGYKKDKKTRNKIEGKSSKVVYNVKDLMSIKKGEIAVIGKVGRKKKIEIVKKAKAEKIPVYNVNVNEFLEKIKTEKERKKKK